MELKDGNIIVYETEDEKKWIILFESWYEPYEGHMHYHALYICDGSLYINGTCFLSELNNLREANEEEKQILINKLKEEGYESFTTITTKPSIEEKNDEIIQHLIEEYNKWYAIESENAKGVKGMRGSNGDLSKFSFDDLFNEVAWRLYVGLK